MAGDEHPTHLLPVGEALRGEAAGGVVVACFFFFLFLSLSLSLSSLSGLLFTGYRKQHQEGGPRDLDTTGQTKERASQGGWTGNASLLF
jgi:hypothetical protein